MTLNAQALLTRLTTRARLRHMQALVMLDDLRSMSRAAQAMGMTQPAMTQLVAELEQLLETTLFLRHSRGVDPTPAAQDLLPVARRILSATEEGAERIATRLRRVGGPVRIAATGAAMGALLDRALPRLVSQHPNLQLQVETVLGQTLAAAFSGDEFDVILCRQQAVVPEGWSFVECYRDVPIIGAAACHPLARKAQVTAEELARCTWLQNHVASLARHIFDDLREQHGWHDLREIRVISRIPELLWSMLRDGKAVCLLLRSIAEPRLRDGSMVALPFPVQTRLAPVGYYWRPEGAGPTQRTLAQALDALREG